MTNLGNLGRSMRLGEQNPATSAASLDWMDLPAFLQVGLEMPEDFRDRYMVDTPSGPRLAPLAVIPTK